jgi:hypothetical protein
MGINLVVRFTGLCAFVPHPSGKRMRVLLVDAPGMPMQPERQGRTRMPARIASGSADMNMDDMNQKMDMEPHVPVLVFDTLDLAPDSLRQADDTFDNGNLMGFCRLNDQDLRISPMQADALALTNGAVAGCPITQRPHSLSWMAQLADLYPGLGLVDDCCLAVKDVHPKVAARLLLTEGTLATHKIAGSETHGWVQWKFGPLGGPLGNSQRAIAEVIELTLPVPGDRVTFNATRFRGEPQEVPPLVLKPQDANGTIVVSIMNMPIKDVKGSRPMEEIELLRTRNRDTHFDHYSRLSANDPGEGLGPIPTAVAVCAQTFDDAPPPILGNPQCPTAAFQPHAGA